MKRSALVMGVLMMGASAPAMAAGQLPKTVVPVRYDITVDPDAATKRFTGRETITVTVKAPTRTVTLNAADLDIGSATIDGRKATLTADDKQQRITLTAAAPLKPGTHTLAFQWKGKINDTAAGFFAIDYKNADGTSARMLATQFEAPDARRFAPMFDEPSFKARFKLSAVAPAGQLAFSNMPATVSKLADGRQLYSFATSPVMSSYLLFLGMGDVERKTVMAGKTEIGIITRRGVVDQGDYALAEAKRLLTYYNDYFGQPYPLPKLDMIAGPGSSQFFGAMENWGAIFYFEPTLLFDPKRATESARQRIFTVVAHEMAHQWFGDLVTMKWWDDLWLNEGFASWMESKASADLNPAWNARASAVTEEREGAMGIDATAATHPIVRHVETVDQIGESFDAITYQKGQAVIGMLESTLGADTFRAGIRRYMARYKYQNTETGQLWAELAAAAGKPVAEIANDFTRQAGVPMVTVSAGACAGGQTPVTLTQSRFGLDAASKTPQRWRVPMVLSTLGGKATPAIVTAGAPNSIRLAGCGTVVGNLGKGSYARIAYDAPSHAAIVGDYAKLDLADRLGTLSDDFALALSGDQTLTPYFAVLGQVKQDASPLEWSTVNGQLSSLIGLFFGTPLEAPLRARSNQILSPVLARIGFVAKPGEEPLVTTLRESLISRLGVNGDPAVMAEARRYVAQLATNPTAIPPSIRQPILNSFAANATPEEWDALFALLKSTSDPVVKNGYVRLLGQSRNPALATRALGLLSGAELTAPQKGSLLATIAGRHPDLAFDWAVANLETVNGFLETSTRAQFVVGLGAGSSDPAMPGKLKAFAEKNIPVESRGGLTRALATIAVNKAAADRLREAVTAWLADAK
ncbi:M1 family metallopeptidase [Sphingomonas sp.]|uniref:M1 family metallopeptidase n=1 Tax=Sphingomonas sp. TaxID=28214 RepID=UPI001D82BA68|nr:M1 family metallopeptidase [Sphingomonas sp.]MBX9797125.1 M1 family metallopeptidase [Sphingomonas sp.]